MEIRAPVLCPPSHSAAITSQTARLPAPALTLEWMQRPERMSRPALCPFAGRHGLQPELRASLGGA
jgi:hypothetical protein